MSDRPRCPRCGKLLSQTGETWWCVKDSWQEINGCGWSGTIEQTRGGEADDRGRTPTRTAVVAKGRGSNEAADPSAWEGNASPPARVHRRMSLVKHKPDCLYKTEPLYDAPSYCTCDEKHVQARVKASFEALPVRVRIVDTSQPHRAKITPGLPDLLVYGPGWYVEVEVKTWAGRASEAQLVHQAAAKRACVDYRIMRGEDDVTRWWVRLNNPEETCEDWCVRPKPHSGGCLRSVDISPYAVRLREALAPFAKFACDEPHEGEPPCHNCIARDLLEEQS